MRWLIQDLQFGLRTNLRHRTVFLTSVLALALGIGATTVMFSVIDNVLLNPFPYLDSQRIFDINIIDRNSRAGYPRNYFSVPEFLDFQDKNRIFESSIGILEETSLLGSAPALESLDTDRVTGNAFQFLGISPLLGRAILPSDTAPGAPPVFVLSYKVWANRFGLDRSILGKTFILNDKPTTLIGIMPRRFAFWGGDIWVPAMLDRAAPDASTRQFVMYGRLKPGLSVKAAEGETFALLTHLAKIYRARYPEQFEVQLESLGSQVLGNVKPTLYLLLASVMLLLLIACANVANLLLAQATAREKEFALRFVLGASRFRLIRQLLAESLLVAVAGAAVGCVFAAAGLKGLLAMLPQYTFPDEAVVGLNNEVLAATVLTAMLTALIFGLAPALAASHGHFNESVKAGSRGNTGFRRGRLRNAFIVSEVALSLLLLSSAGLLMRSFFMERQINLGIHTDHLLITAINLPVQQYQSTDAQARFLRELLPRLQDLPGVRSAAVSTDLPPSQGIQTSLDIPGSSDTSHTSPWKGFVAPSSRQIFSTLGMRLVAGRLITADDENGKRRIAVINQAMANNYFGGQPPVGRQIQIAFLKTALNPLPDPTFEIVGVVSDIKNNGPRQGVVPEAYIPYTVSGFGFYNIFIHTTGNPNALAEPVSRQILALDRNVIPQQTITMADYLELTQYARPRFGLVLFSVFAGIGLLLVSVGVYGVISYSVRQRRQEIGIRIALGATPRDVRSLVVRNGMRVIFTGIALGMLLASIAARALASQLWGVRWYDPLTLAGVIVLLAVVGLLASYLPSVSAARGDPAICLRSEGD
jgi:putative ABC transport system permease protein